MSLFFPSPLSIRWTCPSTCRATNLFFSKRTIIVPKQLKAYGDSFNPSIGERSDHLAGQFVLQSLTPSHTKNSPLLSKFVKTKTIDSFSEMLLCRELRTALINMKIDTPSPIQQTAIEVILNNNNSNNNSHNSNKSVLVAAPHGTGKTLAYLLPLYQNMMKDRDIYRIPLRERRPRMFILAPTNELIDQLQNICNKLEETTGLRAISFTSRKRANYHLNKLVKNNKADVFILHPKTILRLIRSRRLFIDDVRYVAIDEADVMVSSLHDHDAVHLLNKIKKRNMYKYLWPVETKIIFSSSFITRKLEYFIGKEYPNTVTCMHRKEMHQPPDTLQHRFIPVARESEKLSLLIHLLRMYQHVPRPDLLVDNNNNSEEIYYTPHTLSGTFDEFPENGALNDNDNCSADNDNNINNYYHTSDKSEIKISHPDDLARRIELEKIRPIQWEHLRTIPAPFTCPINRHLFSSGQRVIIFFPNTDAATAIFHRLSQEGFACSLLHASLPFLVRKKMFKDFAEGKNNILCATDIAARGLDMPVDIIINFTMPSNAIIYLSRAGRTARMGRAGKVISLYSKYQGVIVSALQLFLKKKIPLEGVSNWKPHMMKPRYAEWKTNKINALARAYVSMIIKKNIPAHLERTYIHHNATWRPLFHPYNTAIHAGVEPKRQEKINNKIMEEAVWYRRAQLSRRKGGRAKFGSRNAKLGVWNDVEGVAFRLAANESQQANPAGDHFGPPIGPPK